MSTLFQFNFFSALVLTSSPIKIDANEMKSTEFCLLLINICYYELHN